MRNCIDTYKFETKKRVAYQLSKFFNVFPLQ